MFLVCSRRRITSMTDVLRTVSACEVLSPGPGVLLTPCVVRPCDPQLAGSAQILCIRQRLGALELGMGRIEALLEKIQAKKKLPASLPWRLVEEL